MTRLRIFARSAFLVCLFAVIVLSLLPREQNPVTDEWDALTHILAYGVLAVLAFIGIGGWRLLILSWFGLMILGAGLEAAQLFVPGRTASAADAIADFTGIVLGSFGAVCANAFLKRRPDK